MRQSSECRSLPAVTNGLHDRLRAALAAGPPLRLAILFGSRARGTSHPGSDVDIAYLPVDSRMSMGEESELGAALERVAGVAVDLVRIDEARGALRWRIARDGIVLLSDPPEAAARFLARAGIEHDDLRELEADAMRRFRARLAATAPEAG